MDNYNLEKPKEERKPPKLTYKQIFDTKKTSKSKSKSK